MSNSTPSAKEAKDAVNVFASIDVLGLLEDKDYPGLGKGKTIEDAIKEYYQDIVGPQDPDLIKLAMSHPLQEWNDQKQQYIFSGLWDTVIAKANANGNYIKFASTSGTEKLLSKYVRLVAKRGDTKGWKLRLDKGDLTGEPPNQYLTEAYNLSIKAKPGQWIRWWSNSITPFSALQCVIAKITNEGRPEGLHQLNNQHSISIVYDYPSGTLGEGDKARQDRERFLISIP